MIDFVDNSSPSLSFINAEFPYPHASEFQQHCLESGIHLFLTQEFVATFGNWIANIILRDGVRRVLEVGAGNGQLSRSLVFYLKSQGVETNWLSTDVVAHPQNGVIGLDYRQALLENPDLVICSWPPPRTDWTDEFRLHRVPNYVVIGDPDDGLSGNARTWRPSLASGQASEGYVKTDLLAPGLVSGLVGRTDQPPFSDSRTRSRIFSFRRQDP